MRARKTGFSTCCCVEKSVDVAVESRLPSEAFTLLKGCFTYGNALLEAAPANSILERTNFPEIHGPPDEYNG